MVGLFRGVRNSWNQRSSPVRWRRPAQLGALLGAPVPVAAPPQGYVSNANDYSSLGPDYDADYQYANQGYYTTGQVTFQRRVISSPKFTQGRFYGGGGDRPPP